MKSTHKTNSMMDTQPTIFTSQIMPDASTQVHETALKFVLSPDITFQRKLDLISRADDMTTSQKLAAIEAAEAKHISDKLIHLTIAVIAITIFTKQGNQIIETVLRKSVLSSAIHQI